MKKITNRKKIENQIVYFCVKKAKEWGCDLVTCKQNTQQGLWGEDMAKFIQSKLGKDAIDEIRWDDAANGKQVEFRHRFGNPCVSLSYNRDKDREVLAEMELSDYDAEASSHTDNYCISQFTVFSEQGLELAKELQELWHKIKKTL